MAATKLSLKTWIVEALQEAGGALHHVRVAEHVWRHHKDELEQSGDLFFTWQYDLRWAAQTLRVTSQQSVVFRRSLFA